MRIVIRFVAIAIISLGSGYLLSTPASAANASVLACCTNCSGVENCGDHCTTNGCECECHDHDT